MLQPLFSHVIYPAEVERAMWWGTACATVVAILLAATSFHIWRRLARESKFRVGAAFAALLLSVASYFTAIGFMLWGIYTYIGLRIVRPSQLIVGGIFVHPGITHRLIPLLAIALTWVLLELRRRRVLRSLVV